MHIFLTIHRLQINIDLMIDREPVVDSHALSHTINPKLTQTGKDDQGPRQSKSFSWDPTPGTWSVNRQPFLVYLDRV